LALGYILGKGSAKLTKTKLIIPLALTLAVIPDIDILAERFDGLASMIPHRGPTHSVVVALIILIPIIAFYGKAALPYLVALLSHSLLGDYFAGGQLQLLWPISQQRFGLLISIQSLQNVTLELTLFIVFIALLAVTRDLYVFLQPHKSNLILAIPTFTVLLPTFLSYPLDVPILMIPPHVIYTIIFAFAIIIEIFALLKLKTVK
jgi:membrane-bound metal-dependent hydrolase YbcI (DUF457 family)